MTHSMVLYMRIVGLACVLGMFAMMGAYLVLTFKNAPPWRSARLWLRPSRSRQRRLMRLFATAGLLMAASIVSEIVLSNDAERRFLDANIAFLWLLIGVLGVWQPVYRAKLRRRTRKAARPDPGSAIPLS